MLTGNGQRAPHRAMEKRGEEKRMVTISHYNKPRSVGGADMRDQLDMICPSNKKPLARRQLQSRETSSSSSFASSSTPTSSSDYRCALCAEHPHYPRALTHSIL
jgi:hypothetical protein